VEELQAATRRILEEHFAAADREKVAVLVTRALLDEVCTTPKPGLVDRNNNGSHRDMDIFTFTASAAALASYWAKCVQIGQETAQNAPEETFALLRRAGQAAECGAMVFSVIKDDFAALERGSARTAGQKLYLKLGLTGVRREAAKGFPSVLQIALPALKSALDVGLSRNDAGAVVLLHLIAQGIDTNMVARGGPKLARAAVPICWLRRISRKVGRRMYKV